MDDKTPPPDYVINYRKKLLEEEQSEKFARCVYLINIQKTSSYKSGRQILTVSVAICMLLVIYEIIRFGISREPMSLSAFWFSVCYVVRKIANALFDIADIMIDEKCRQERFRISN
jgi:hypothetical protein